MYVLRLIETLVILNQRQPSENGSSPSDCVELDQCSECRQAHNHPSRSCAIHAVNWLWLDVFDLLKNAKNFFQSKVLRLSILDQVSK